MKSLRKVLAVILIISVCSCGTKDAPSGLNADKKFHHYISLEDKVFKDGEVDFYPMVLNYSVDIFNKDASTSSGFFATPRKGYHPEYGKGEGENMNPWGADSAVNHRRIRDHFISIKDMGFNAIRLTGFTATDAFDNGFHTWSKVDISNTPKGNENIQKGMIPLLKTILGYAEESGLRVILLLSAVETQADNQNNFFAKVAKGLADEKALMAYDLYNEPIYFDRGEYTKKQTKAFVESYNKSIKDNAPKHLTTIGLTHYKIVYEWDPELMDVDFLSFHLYPYWSKNLSLLERFDSKLYWVANNITKPWIVGETGLNTVEECDPMNLASGTIEDQLYFMSYSLNKFRSAGASGYSWWSYQDTREKLEGECPHSSCYGLVDRKKGKSYKNSAGGEIVGGIKHEPSKLPFAKFTKDAPYRTKFWDNVPMPSEADYYNIDYLPDHENAVGKVIDEHGDPVEDAIVTLRNPISKAVYSTFTRPDGSFDLKTGWTNVFTKLDFEIRVTAVRMETRKIALKEIYKGEGNKLEDIVIAHFK
jgi:exo-beta-1,3-glucanase (GH17 family)